MCFASQSQPVYETNPSSRVICGVKAPAASENLPVIPLFPAETCLAGERGEGPSALSGEAGGL